MIKRRRKTYDRQEIFDWIVAYKRSHDGNSPTVQEIMDGCGVSSKSVVYYILLDLRKLGLIELPGYNKDRQIRVVGGRWSYG